MKNLAFILLLFPFISFAQESDRTFRFGMKIAPALCWMKPDFKGGSGNFEATNNGVNLGFNWGPMLEINLDETFLIFTGVNLQHLGGYLKGTSQRDAGNVYTWKHEYNARYVELPLMIKGRTREIGHMCYFMQFGLSAAYRYKEDFILTESLATGDTNPKLTGSEAFTSVFKGTMLVGAGAEYNFHGGTSLIGSLTFNNGLTNFIRDKGIKNHLESSYPNDDFNNVELSSPLNFMELSIGVLF